MHWTETGAITNPSFARQPQDTLDSFEELIEKKKEQRLALMSHQGVGGEGDPQQQQQQQQQLLQSLLKRQSEGPAALIAGGGQIQDTKRQRTGEGGKEADLTSPSLSLATAAAGIQGQQQQQQQAITPPRQADTTTVDALHPLAPHAFPSHQQVRAQLEARLLQQEINANRNAALLASILGQPQHSTAMPYPSLPHHFPLQGPAPGALGNPTVDSFLAGLITRNQSIQGMPPNSSLSQQQFQPHAQMLAAAPVDVNAMIRHLAWPPASAAAAPAHASLPNLATAGNVNAAASAIQPSQGIATSSLRLPPCDEGLVPHYSEREPFPLGVDEDPNWLSEFHCFVRSELIEICRASHDDCKSRNNATSYLQVGVRCRFCAHRPPTARGCRSSAYPSSIRQIYQSFTMMLRDHFGSCESIPNDVKQRFLTLKDKPSQGATDSKRYWMYSAMKAGLADSPDGIIINHNTLFTGRSAPPFGSEDVMLWRKEAAMTSYLVLPNDPPVGNAFFQALLKHAQVVHLREAERIGNRRSLEHGLPGFSCRHCWEKRRLGLCRMFPARRRTLLQKMMDLYDHLRRCSATPANVRQELERLRNEETNEEDLVDNGETKALLDRVWIRLGHGN